MAKTVSGAGPRDILGLWKTAGGDSQLEFFRCGEKICGKIVWLKVPYYINKKDGPLFNLHDGVVQDGPDLAPHIFRSCFEVFPLIIAGGRYPLQP